MWGRLPSSWSTTVLPSSLCMIRRAHSSGVRVLLAIGTVCQTLPNVLCFSGGRLKELSGRAVRRPILGRGRDFSNRRVGRPARCKQGLGIRAEDLR